MTANPTGHPARFSEEIVAEFKRILVNEYPQAPLLQRPPILWDPFAGTGEALAALAYDLGYPFGGTEIEPEFIVDPNITVGDATHLETYPAPPFVIITSPAYPNGVADAWKMADDSKRFTYQAALDALVAERRELHGNNQGRYGYRGSRRGGRSRNRENYWRVADLAVSCWGAADMILLNVSDFKVKDGATEPLVLDWRSLLREYGWNDQTELHVETQRIGFGANSKARVEHETIVVAKR